MIDLQLQNVSKKYRIRRETDGNVSLVRKLLSIRKRKEDFWALKDISFDVQRAQALGIIGHNGAGKSTILKLLSRITTPTTGEIMINGRLSALIEVGSGFHPELTGRENIYLNGSILGMRRREITQKLESIVEFAELRQFIDTPVKRYSSGMYVRLGFSIAAHLDPDVLLLDEVLAVGDAAFQRKCIQRITELKKNGTTIVFISHDLRAVQQLCERVILLKKGRIEADGDPAETIALYQSMSAQLSGQTTGGVGQKPTGEAVVTSLSFYDENENECLSFETGKPMKAVLNYKVHEPLTDVIFEVQFYSQEGRLCSFFSSETLGRKIDVEAGEGSIVFDCSSVGLGPGVYFIDTGIRNRLAPYGIDIDWRRRCIAVRIDYDRHLRDTFYMPYICRHVTPEAFANRDPVTPEAFANRDPVTPEAFANRDPVTPEAFANRDPVTPEAFANRDPVTPEAFANRDPVTPEAFANRDPVTPEAFVNRDPVTPEAFANRSPVTPEAFANRDPVTPEAFANRSPGLERSDNPGSVNLNKS